MAHILIVDDELGIRDLLWEILEDEGHQVEVAENAAEARAVRARVQPDLVLLDVWMPDTDGVTLLKEWSAASLLTMPVIMMSGHATIDTAIEATKLGARAFLEKPITLQKLLKAVEAGLSEFDGEASRIPVRGGAEVPNIENESSETLVQAQCAAPEEGSQRSFSMDKPLRESRDEFEKAYFQYHLAREGGSMTRVADKTGLERTHLYRKLRQLGVDVGRIKKVGD